MRRYLVVANQTLGGMNLARVIAERAAAGPSHFHVLVPASRPSTTATWTEGEARAQAEERLLAALAWFSASGWEATGEVGDQQPLMAIADVLIERPCDEIILSTLPAGLSRWLRQDLPNRCRRAFGLPVTHVEGDPAITRVSA